MKTSHRVLRSARTNLFTLLMAFAAVSVFATVIGLAIVGYDTVDTATNGPMHRARTQAQQDIEAHKAILLDDYSACARHFRSDASIVSCMRAREEDRALTR